MPEILVHWFAAVCGQDPGHSWAPGGILLPCCQRCTGLYVGAAVAMLLHLWLRPKLSGRFLEIHGAFLLAMVPFGYHWVPQGPALRAMSGVLFGFAVVTFLWLPLSQRVQKQFSNPDGRAPLPSILKVPVFISGDWFLRISDFGLPSGLGFRVSDFCRIVLTHWHREATYFLVLVATLVLIPTTAMLGGSFAAYGLSSLAFCGALSLVALVIGDISLALAGVLRLRRWLTGPRLQP